jgi:8-oxo-dGTP pyrophosphatase MutT (NUDIX family)
MHVDVHPGDRAATCRALMKPIGLLYERGEFVVVHECAGCGVKRRNRAAADDDLSRLLEPSRYRDHVVIDRQAARVVLTDGERVLLQHGFDPARPEDGTWWLTPGGGLNGGESVEDGAVREVREETGLRLSPDRLGPVIATRVCFFNFERRRYRQSETFFAVRVEPFTPEHHGWDEVEQRALIDHRWWTVEELRTTDESVYPRQLAELVEAVLGGSLEAPMHLPEADED